MIAFIESGFNQPWVRRERWYVRATMSATTASREPSGFLARRFRLHERGTNPRTEALGGVATFLTMSYIVFVNPAILSAAGVPLDAVIVCTALAAAITTAAMALATNLPFALAPGLGINAIVAFDIILGRGLPWQVGMAVVVIEGLVAVILVLAGLRTAIMEAVPMSLKLAIGVGIGLFITLVGLREGGIVVNNPATGIGLGDLTAGPPLIALAGILVAAVLVARGQRGAVILGVVAATVLGLIFGVLERAGRRGRRPGLGRVLDHRRAARSRLPRRRADGRADPGHLRAVHDRLLRHHRHRRGGRPRRRHARRPRPAPATPTGCCWSTRAPRRSAARWASRA